MEKLVSVIVPIYNQEKYLNISIPAIQKQSYSNLEILLINDGSIDRSKDIIEKYKLQDHRIKIIQKENGGLVDATIVGIEHASGKFIAFIDPDDYVGEDFIENLVNAMEEDCDFVATGFYYEKNGALSPYILSETRSYKGEALSWLSTHYLFEPEINGIPKTLFFSRWNKLYRKECVLKAIKIFKKCKNVSLGEDSIFTYLILKNSQKGKTLQGINSYYYNVGNQNSMMKSEDIDNYLKKAFIAFQVYSDVIKSFGDEIDQAVVLYYYLVESLFQRLWRQGGREFFRLYSCLKKDKVYKNALSFLIKYTKNKRTKLLLRLKKYIPFAFIYLFITNNTFKFLKKIKNYIEDTKFIFTNFKKNGIRRTSYAYKFKKDRRNAFRDINKCLPLLEQRIKPLLEKFKGKTTDFEKSSINKNIFIFWWDGFECAPEIVKACLQSIKKFHKDCNVIEITKHNFLNYTDIHSIIIQDYNAGKISIQTFSDILRFNLLKNNGGTWIDSTIFFAAPYNLFDSLLNKPIESICFSTTKDFLKYDGLSCSWSGYFFASRKGSVFVEAVDYVFQEYYLKHHTYSIYFFIDAVLMLCKKYGIDGNALNNIQYNKHDMALLSKLLSKNYDPWAMKEIKSIPQKLTWFNKNYNANKDSFYTILLLNKEV